MHLLYTFVRSYTLRKPIMRNISVVLCPPNCYHVAPSRAHHHHQRYTADHLKSICS